MDYVADGTRPYSFIVWLLVIIAIQKSKYERTKLYAIVWSSKLVSVWRPNPPHKRTHCPFALGFVIYFFFHS